MGERISRERYDELFNDNPRKSDSGAEAKDKKSEDAETKKTEALKYALEIRSFEIELYWKRATYFWAFIGATLAGYGAVQASSIPSKADLSVALSCLGLVFSFGWFLVNKGSKQWQENWENHVDLLEDDIIGPLYKIVLTRPEPSKKKWLKRFVVGPGPFSVSKINQIISLFVIVLWLFLLWEGLQPTPTTSLARGKYIGMIAATGIAWWLFWKWGKTESYEKGVVEEEEQCQNGIKVRNLIAMKRHSTIKPERNAENERGSEAPPPPASPR